MKNLLFTFVVCLFANILFSQFTIKGKIENYKNKKVLIKLNKGFDFFVAGNLLTDKEGNFSSKITIPYTGLIMVVLPESRTIIYLAVDNKNINFINKIGLESSEFIDYGSPINKAYYLELNKDPNSNYKDFPFLEYFFSFSLMPKDKEHLLDFFINSGEFFNTCTNQQAALIDYLDLFYKGNDETEKIKNVEKAADELLEIADIETERGQTLLNGLIKFASFYDFQDLFQKYINLANSLVCEISSELKNTIDINERIKVGKKIPNISFSNLNKGKYKNLYDIPSKYKLLMLWASWCSHCEESMPYVEQFYNTFKQKNGEIIGLSIDTDEKVWKEFIKKLPWLNDNDFLGWDSQYVKDLNIEGTPTFILVDHDNKILVILNQIEEIANFFNNINNL